MKQMMQKSSKTKTITDVSVFFVLCGFMFFIASGSAIIIETIQLNQLNKQWEQMYCEPEIRNEFGHKPIFRRGQYRRDI